MGGSASPGVPILMVMRKIRKSHFNKNYHWQQLVERSSNAQKEVGGLDNNYRYDCLCKQEYKKCGTIRCGN
jgi:hypothetical protein